jgi:hypothetical protein
MRWMTEDATVVCTHQLGNVTNKPSQKLVTVDGRKVLVKADPEGRNIKLCPNINVTMKPCTQTLQVTVGYSTLLKVDGQAVCLDTVMGLTNGTPPGIVQYIVRDPGQRLVESVA